MSIIVMQDTSDNVSIEFTQFLLPHGRRVKQYYTPSNPELLDKAKRITDAGFEFTCEVLTNGTVVFYVTDNENELDVQMVMSPNDATVHDKIEEMINSQIEDMNEAEILKQPMQKGIA